MSAFIPGVAPLSGNDIEKIAERELQTFSPERITIPGPVNVIGYFDSLEDRGLDPGVQVLEYGTEGITFPTGRVILNESTYVSAVAGDGRARFTVVHEAFHGICHVKQLRSQLVHCNLKLTRQTDLPAYRNPEWQANTFASAFLMPRLAVSAMAAGLRGRQLAETIADTFNVSFRAAEVRMRRLAIP